jgi:hypothetical protein
VNENWKPPWRRLTRMGLAKSSSRVSDSIGEPMVDRNLSISEFWELMAGEED